MTGTLIVVLYLVGLVLIAAEILLPGVVLGLMGIGCVVAGIWMAFARNGDTLGWVLVGCTVAVIPVGVVFWLKVLKRVFTLRHAEKTQEGYVGSRTDAEALVGREGVTVSALRPAGWAEFDGRKLHVVSEGDMIPQGTRVTIREVVGNRIVVRARRY